jgi:hypothetical protein
LRIKSRRRKIEADAIILNDDSQPAIDVIKH